MSYCYTPLQDAELDIRLLRLHPGQFDEPIQVTLHPARLAGMTSEEAPQRLTLKELQKTLPRQQWVEQTREGRFFFFGKELGTSWRHPDPGFPRELYAAPKQLMDNRSELSFEALSYAWGAPDLPTMKLAVGSSDSDPSSGTLHVRRNLYEAFQHLRSPDDLRTLWVDAICINQEDVDERNKQIKQMKSIYGKARQVIIWLGSSSDNSDLACSTLSYLGAQIVQTRDANVSPHPEATEMTWFRHELELPFDEPTYEAIDNLVRRPWFQRLWVWQEAVLADERACVQCGSKQIPWVQFRAAIARLCANSIKFSSRKWQLEFAQQLTEYTRAHPLYDLTIGTTLRLCTEPRDRVYALLGIAPLEYSQAISVDYSLAVAQVYKDALMAYVRVFKDLALLTHCSPLNRNYDTPSWVPDWTSESNRPWHMGAHFAGAQSAACADFIQPDTLVVHGVRCATVTNVGATCDWGKHTEESYIQILNTIRSWLPKDINEGSYVTGETKPRAYIHTLIVDKLADFCSNNNVELLDAYNGFWDLVRSRDGIHKDFDLEDAFVTQLVVACRGSCFFETEEGYFGQMHSGVEPGDQVCVLLGLSRPVVLRQLTGGKYKVIGIAYVHGLDRSEGLLGPIPQPWEWNLNWVPDDWTWLQLFRNTETGVLTDEDPRLGDLPEGWSKSQCWDPEDRLMPMFCNDRTGEETKFDPRLTPDNLREIGSKVQEFALV